MQTGEIKQQRRAIGPAVVRAARKLALASVLGASILLAFLLIAELGLRVYYRRPIAEQYYRPIGGIAGYGLQPSKRYEYWHGGRTVSVTTNEDGTRVVPGAQSTAPANLYVIGDSQAFGWGLSDAETIPANLQTQLGSGWRVVNLGVPGYGPFAYVEKLNQTPDDGVVIVIQAESNDLQDAYFVQSPMLARCGFLVSHSLLAAKAPCLILSSYTFARTVDMIIGVAGTLSRPLGYQPCAARCARDAIPP